MGRESCAITKFGFIPYDKRMYDMLIKDKIADLRWYLFMSKAPNDYFKI